MSSDDGGRRRRRAPVNDGSDVVDRYRRTHENCAAGTRGLLGPHRPAARPGCHARYYCTACHEELTLVRIEDTASTLVWGWAAARPHVIQELP